MDNTRTLNIGNENLKRLNERFMAFISCEKGATAIEYSLITGLIALVLVGAVNKLGVKTTTILDQINGAMLGEAEPPQAGGMDASSPATAAPQTDN